ncbi:MAG: four helix bundle protein [Fibromonadales bacterium]|nr:four helix bundle protein [Fibromonadales bacterium]
MRVESENKGVVAEKSYGFAVNTVLLYKFLSETKKEFILSKQLLRSGTSIGANIREAKQAQSKPDFLNKMNIALKEANETLYWIDLLFDTGYISIDKKQRYHKECNDLVSLLSAVVKTTKKNLGAKYAK